MAKMSYIQCGVVGSVITLSGFIISAIGFTGVVGEGYSLLNHFVSELGISGVSPWALAFNIGLIAGGILLAFFIAGLARLLSTRSAQILGIVAAVCCSLVGVFPAEDYLILYHAVSAMTFFFVATVTILIFTVVIWKQKGSKVQQVLAIPGLVVVAAFCVFLIYSFSGNGNFSDFHEAWLHRPEFWASAFLEWIAVLSIIGWLAVVSISLSRGGLTRPAA